MTGYRPDFDNPSAMEGVVFGALFGLALWVLIFGVAYLLSFA